MRGILSASVYLIVDGVLSARYYPDAAVPSTTTMIAIWSLAKLRVQQGGNVKSVDGTVAHDFLVALWDCTIELRRPILAAVENREDPRTVWSVWLGLIAGRVGHAA